MFEKLGIPGDMVETLEKLYAKVKQYNPRLTKPRLLEHIISQWLDNYTADKPNKIRIIKKQAVLNNDLKMAIALSGKSQKQLAKEIGIHHTYLNQIINKKSEPSITVALLIAEALDYPPNKLHELFYLEQPASEE